jgi:hypothetical protein
MAFEFLFLGVNNNYWQGGFINNIWLFLKINLEPLWNIYKKEGHISNGLAKLLENLEEVLKSGN